MSRCKRSTSAEMIMADTKAHLRKLGGSSYTEEVADYREYPQFLNCSPLYLAIGIILKDLSRDEPEGVVNVAALQDFLERVAPAAKTKPEERNDALNTILRYFTFVSTRTSEE